MPRYIDAGAFDKVLEFYAAAYSPLDGTKERHVHETIQSCREYLKRAETVGAAPVVHAEWIPNAEMIRSPAALNYHCSNCGVASHTYSFCPNCGAAMKGRS